jgi:ATP diphosphatase
MTSKIKTLKDIMRKLRDPETGCPWDINQDFHTIVQHTIEEAYEVADAVDKKDYAALKSELGDLLLQVIFYAQIADEEQLFDFEQVVEAVCEKLVYRHPHVFGEQEINTAEEQEALWSQLKEKERSKKAVSDGDTPSILHDIPDALPSLIRSYKLQKRAATVGFDWPDHVGVIEKIEEELAEVKKAIESGNSEEITEEIGDLLFSVSNLSRKMKVNPEELLRMCNRKFERRFQYIEQQLRVQKKSWEKTTLEEMERYWQEAKKL